MPVREFADSKGQTWRAWDITPEAIRAQTRAEDYLADCYREGWVVFENVATGEKKRLCPLPAGWQTLSAQELQRLLLAAEPVLRTRHFPDTVPAQPPDRAAAPADAGSAPPVRLGEVDFGELGLMRSFLYPGGRVWTVGVVRQPEGGGPPVLRFQSGLRHIDLTDWPVGWADRTDTELVALLRDAAPRAEAWRHGLPRRRHGDV